MIGGKDHNRVVEQARLLQGRQQTTDLVVEVGHQAVVRAAQAAQALGLAQVEAAGAVVGVEPAIHRRIGLIEVGREFGDGNVGVCVAVPVRLRRMERLVWMVEGSAEKERGIAALGAEVLDSAELRLFVVAEGIVPEVDPDRLAGVATGVVRGPVAHDLLVVVPLGLLDADPLFLDPRKVGRVDVGRQPAVEAV